MYEISRFASFKPIFVAIGTQKVVRRHDVRRGVLCTPVHMYYLWYTCVYTNFGGKITIRIVSSKNIIYFKYRNLLFVTQGVVHVPGFKHVINSTTTCVGRSTSSVHTHGIIRSCTCATLEGITKSKAISDSLLLFSSSTLVPFFLFLFSSCSLPFQWLVALESPRTTSLRLTDVVPCPIESYGHKCFSSWPTIDPCIFLTLLVRENVRFDAILLPIRVACQQFGVCNIWLSSRPLLALLCFASGSIAPIHLWLSDANYETMGFWGMKWVPSFVEVVFASFAVVSRPWCCRNSVTVVSLLVFDWMRCRPF